MDVDLDPEAEKIEAVRRIVRGELVIFEKNTVQLQQVIADQ
jgi:hypothetical protein